MTDLIVENIHKYLGALHILKGANFTATRGQIVALLGASGSGKTTLLRTIAGLEIPEEGRIVIGGTLVVDTSKGLVLPPERRNIGLVFQSYALWPHRTVFENVAFGLKLRGVSSADITERVNTSLTQMGLGHLGDRFPFQLSGGQQQRVAICRALVYQPKVILLDEPLSNLDAKLREEARFWIRKLILERELCAVVVTHDQSEALAMSDHILLLKDGAIAQEGSPLEIYGKPTNRFAAEFLGNNNVLSGDIAAPAVGSPSIKGNGWQLDGVVPDTAGVKDGGKGVAVIRMEQTRIVEGPGENRLPMKVEACIYLGDRWEYRLTKGDLTIRSQGATPLESEEVWCEVPRQHVWLFAA
ncbi:ABC transporter ATP-binding protein [Agrobacterium larrymoorei]|uniref:ABC transporter ATP-binding protein n=1 Tax=Agrobacterium larrymoorei TaxID=160699 RepID=A0AAF0HDQ4_9HYPH|nr:ABC transporter ATP-binding protein [Agrobacterium larrymoorei]WHA44012.1 ABC transporter ATP-binding protein [Agrobacterium larrymoorei]